MFKIHVNDNIQEMPEDDIFYIVAKEGIFLKKKMGIMESLAPVKNISTLESVQSSAKMHINKIPATSFAKVIDFFRKVYTAYRGESIVLLFYNEESKKYRIIPPHQKVSSASIDYNRGMSLEGWMMIGTIHSHAGMSAFHSGVDDSDEETFDGLHITIGNVNDDNVSISSSIVANGYRVITEPEEYISGLKKVVDIDETEPFYTSKIYKWIDGKLQLDEEASKKSLTTRRKFDKRYVSTASPSKSVCNPKWMSVVERGTYQWPKRSYMGRFAHGRYGGYGGYGGHYDSHLWHQGGRFLKPEEIKKQQQGLPPGHWSKHQIENQIIIDNLTDENFLQTDDETIPCLTCKHRDMKILMEENDEFEEMLFKCGKCGIIIKDDEFDDFEKLECPNCKTGDHFTLVDISELESNYKPLTNEEILAMQSDEDTEGFHVCKGCGNSFLKFESDTECPFCQTQLLPEVLSDTVDVSELTGEDSLIQQSLNDSGALLGEESSEIQEEALKQAAQEDKNLEKIPDPEKEAIPLSLQHSPTPGLLDLFKNVFKKGK